MTADKCNCCTSRFCRFGAIPWPTRLARILAIRPFLMTLAFALTLGSGCSHSRQEDKLEGAFRAYMAAWQHRDMHAVWELMSPRLKAGNDDNEHYFRDYAEQQGVFPSKYVIRRVFVSGDYGSIVADLKYADESGKIVFEEREECRFVTFGPRWYFDDCKPAATAAAA
jgi:hypothetical protein